MSAEVEGILLWAIEGLQRLVKNGFQFTESDRAKRNRELVKRDNNNVFDFLESEGYIRLKADACTSSKELYEVYRMWCEENSLNAIKARGFSDALIANQRRYDLESTSNIVNSSGWRVRGFVAIEVLVQPDLSPNGWRAAIKPESDAGRRGLRLADNDKISRKGHRTALRCCRCPFLDFAAV